MPDLARLQHNKRHQLEEEANCGEAAFPTALGHKQQDASLVPPSAVSATGSTERPVTATPQSSPIAANGQWLERQELWRE
jgi:hypothetical protein